MKLCVIFTGGTIGSRTAGDTVVGGSAPYALLDGLDGSDIEFTTDEPYNILSEELTAKELNALAECVGRHLPDCDGIIVTHGTDTLVYTAAFLSCLFGDCGKGIVLVSSGYPLDDSRANGRENFAAAVEYLRGGLSGVYAVWTADGKQKLHSGGTLLRQLPYDDMLYSLGGAEQYRRTVPKEMSGFGRVMYLKALPAMYYPPLTEGVSAVLIESYHSGTLCADGRFAEFMKSAETFGIPVFIAGTGGRSAEYETAAKFKKLGAIPLPKVSPDAAYIALCIAASTAKNGAEIIGFMTGKE